MSQFETCTGLQWTNCSDIWQQRSCGYSPISTCFKALGLVPIRLVQQICRCLLSRKYVNVIAKSSHIVQTWQGNISWVYFSFSWFLFPQYFKNNYILFMNIFYNIWCGMPHQCTGWDANTSWNWMQKWPFFALFFQFCQFFSTKYQY